MVMPPARENVWICTIPTGHLQATGVDAKGRKQYRYHRQYRATRDQAKFSRMPAFGSELGIIRRRFQEDLNRRGLPKEKVLATIVRLLDTTYIRVGNSSAFAERAASTRSCN
jgi:DNA topoisomerase-1